MQCLNVARTMTKHPLLENDMCAYGSCPLKDVRLFSSTDFESKQHRSRGCWFFSQAAKPLHPCPPIPILKTYILETFAKFRHKNQENQEKPIKEISQIRLALGSPWYKHK